MAANGLYSQQARVIAYDKLVWLRLFAADGERWIPGDDIGMTVSEARKLAANILECAATAEGQNV